jgi:histidinol-phosphate aminotransferase
MSQKKLLNRNEVIQGPSKECMKVFKKFKLEHASSYQDGYFGSDLEPHLAKKFNFPKEQIITGYGSEDILRMIFNTLEKNDIILINDFHFTYYDKYIQFKEKRIENFKMIEREKEYSFDIDDCIKKMQVLKPKIVLITSPNNPTGNSINPSDFLRIMRATNKETVVVLDEAYVGFDKKYKEREYLEIVRKYENAMLVRSFSKFYALAGLRIGFAICGKEIRKMIQYQNQYLGKSRILEEVAVAALKSKKYYENLSKKITGDRENFTKAVQKLRHFKVFKSNANFVLVKTEKSKKTTLEKALEKEKFLISKFVSDDAMRVTIGSKKHTEKFLKILKKIDA